MKRALPYLLLLATFATPLYRGSCETFTISELTDSVVGDIRAVTARSDETLIDIAREFDLGYDQIVKANPNVNRWLPDDGAQVILPELYILPGSVRRGLVLNISELRLYYYPPVKKGAPQEVRTYPVSIGRMDWRTPLGATKVVKKERDPAWRPPRAIREEHARDGDPLPEVIPGGSPENPLGRFALRLGLPTYLIHGVDERKSFGIGMRVTHGCVRMYPEDIEQLFELVPVNTQVLLVDEPIKIGRRGNSIFLSVHQPLDEREDESLPPLPRVSLTQVTHQVRNQLGSLYDIPVDLLTSITEEGDGIPHEIARVAPRPQENSSVATTAIPQKSDLSDDAYYRAISKYYEDIPTPPHPKPTQTQHRAPAPPPNPDDDAAVRQYLERRY